MEWVTEVVWEEEWVEVWEEEWVEVWLEACHVEGEWEEAEVCLEVEVEVLEAQDLEEVMVGTLDMEEARLEDMEVDMEVTGNRLLGMEHHRKTMERRVVLELEVTVPVVGLEVEVVVSEVVSEVELKGSEDLNEDLRAKEKLEEILFSSPSPVIQPK